MRSAFIATYISTIPHRSYHMKSTISKMKNQVQRGFTLVEIAIVLVIIGLLIGGVLRGQELLNSARANSIAAQMSSVQTAYYGFIDRYKATPGDLTVSQAVAVGTLAIAAVGTAGDGQVTLADSPTFFNNLAQAGFLACTPCTPTAGANAVAAGNGVATAATYAAAPTVLSSSNTMTNVFGSPIAFMNDSTNGAGSTVAGAMVFYSSTAEPGRPMLTTGGTLTSGMLAELDRKSDDGVASGGSLRISDVQGTAGFALGAAGAGALNSAAASAKCAVAAGTWVTPSSGPCQGAFMF
jgi:prepilin-type N-terminal cleavage/methylation domain-containing protein